MDTKEKKLWSDYQQTGDPEPLILYYKSFAKAIARSKHSKLPSFVSYEDIEASAVVGLWMAITRFDITRGVPFEGFARQRIQGRIIDDIREEDHSSRSTRDLQKEIKKAEAEFNDEYNRPPSTSELADKLDITQEEALKYKRRVHRSNVVSLDSVISSDGSKDLARLDLLPGIKDQHNIDEHRVMEIVMSTFVKREKLLFALLYFEGLTLHEAAPAIGLTHPMTCQMHFRLGDHIKRMTQRAMKDKPWKRQSAV